MLLAGLLALITPVAVSAVTLPLRIDRRPSSTLNITTPSETDTIGLLDAGLSVREVSTASGDIDSSIHGGFTVASAIGVAVSVVFTLCVMVALGYSIYYRQQKLKLQRARLQIENNSLPTDLRQEEVINLEVIAPSPSPIPATHRLSLRTDLGRAHAPNYCIAVQMASTAQFSPAVYSAIQYHNEPKSPATGNSKMNASFQEEKVLGRCEDFRSNKSSTTTTTATTDT